MGGGQPAQRDRVADRRRGHQPPVAGAGVEAGPVDVGDEVACAAAEQPGGVPSALVVVESRSSGG
ncbi:MAG: hypothetical protein GEU74_14420 [Nitriliruptorales bacterium]|nr:hypothetical protein [Nitriliruptorales bacterium]